MSAPGDPALFFGCRHRQDRPGGRPVPPSYRRRRARLERRGGFQSRKRVLHQDARAQRRRAAAPRLHPPVRQHSGKRRARSGEPDPRAERRVPHRQRRAAACPLAFIDQAVPERMAGHPKPSSCSPATPRAPCRPSPGSRLTRRPTIHRRLLDPDQRRPDRQRGGSGGPSSAPASAPRSWSCRRASTPTCCCARSPATASVAGY